MRSFTSTPPIAHKCRRQGQSREQRRSQQLDRRHREGQCAVPNARAESSQPVDETKKDRDTGPQGRLEASDSLKYSAAELAKLFQLRIEQQPAPKSLFINRRVAPSFRIRASTFPAALIAELSTHSLELGASREASDRRSCVPNSRFGGKCRNSQWRGA